MVVSRRRLGAGGAPATGRVRPLLHDARAPPGPRVPVTAVSKEPAGPFVDDSSGPLVCPPDGGAIDPSPLVTADGRAYLLWKSDTTAGIVAQELAPDGLSLVGDQQPILQADQAWEAGVVEAPSMVGYDGLYYLFYSGNNWSTASYA